MTDGDVDWVRRWEGEEGAHWVDEAERYDTMNRAFGEAMLDAADLQPGERVLDVGCGNGATTIEAARRVRPDGAALGVDLSSRMLALARERAAATGVGEAEFLRADVQVHAFREGEWDVVVSRFGVMFFDDPHAAFANLARALRPGGRIVFVTWQDMTRSEWIMVPGAAAAAHVGLPQGIAPDAPGPFGLADPDRIREILGRAGFTGLTLEELIRPMRIGDDLDDVEMFFTRSLPLVRDLLAAAPADKASAAVAAARKALEPYAGPEGVVMNENGAWLVIARH
ncbi:MAG: class I SAM-dependent methyltransferase [Acidimicrobiia bacterium]